MSTPVKDSLLGSVVMKLETNLQAVSVLQVLESLLQGLDLVFQMLLVVQAPLQLCLPLLQFLPHFQQLLQ